MSEKKKIMAAVSAVMKYLEEEAAAVAMQAASQDNMALPPMPPTRFWGVSGRQAQMQMRNMMQLKAFHRLR